MYNCYILKDNVIYFQMKMILLFRNSEGAHYLCSHLFKTIATVDAINCKCVKLGILSREIATEFSTTNSRSLSV